MPSDAPATETQGAQPSTRPRKPRTRARNTKPAVLDERIANSPLLKRRGQPSLYTPDRAETVIAFISAGYLVKEAAAAVGVHRDTVAQWTVQYPEFSDAYERARDRGGDFMAEDTLEIADNVKEEPKSRDVRIKARHWFLEHTTRRFAPKPQIEITQNILSMSPEARDKLALDLIGDLRAISQDNQARKVIEAEATEIQPETPDSEPKGGIGG